MNMGKISSLVVLRKSLPFSDPIRIFFTEIISHKSGQNVFWGKNVIELAYRRKDDECLASPMPL